VNRSADRDDVRALLVDYGGVISRPQPADAIAAMASLTGLEVLEFRERYWGHRVPYDRGADARAFWSEVIGGRVDDDTLERLIRLDIESWSHLNQATLAVLMDAHERGCSLSLLSNAPEELAVAVSDRPEFADFDHLLFSARIGAVKPDAAAFDAAVHELGHPREHILFIDDRPANVAGAIGSGLRAVLFTSAAALRAELAPA
jgi:putative hydrolase of the HAD superfamily